MTAGWKCPCNHAELRAAVVALLAFYEPDAAGGMPWFRPHGVLDAIAAWARLRELVEGGDDGSADR